MPVADGPTGADRYREHCSFFWSAGDDDKRILLVSSVAADGPVGRDQAPLTSLEIMDWPCALPAQFPKYSKFVAYGFSYDATQLLTYLPFEIAWTRSHLRNGAIPPIANVRQASITLLENKEARWSPRRFWLTRTSFLSLRRSVNLITRPTSQSLTYVDIFNRVSKEP